MKFEQLCPEGSQLGKSNMSGSPEFNAMVAATWICRTVGLSETIIVTIPLFLSKSTCATKLSANTGATMQGGLWY